MTNRIKLPPNRRKPPVRKQTTPGHRNIAYFRVSTALQDADNQKLGIVEYTYAEGLQVEVMSVLDQLIKKGCRIHAVKGGYRLDQSLSSKILSMVLLMAPEIERELVSQRTKEALARRKAEGKQLGRPKGSYEPTD